jgi:UDP-2,4-diacetamido-2,4,6-trideoxy-beta-L-altropyranose hydrolase
MKKSLRIVIRVDASIEIGIGHVMRCLTLAQALKEDGSNVQFICRKHKGHLIENIKAKGFEVFSLELFSENKCNNELFHSDWLGVTQQQDAQECASILKDIQPDWLIVDHYAIDKTWQSQLKWTYKKLMIIDDLADRNHQCDILLDQTFGRQGQEYKDIVPSHCELLLGSKYALLRPEFTKWRNFSLARRSNPEFKKLLISMGGTDPNNITVKVLEALKECNLPKELEITVIMGTTSPNLDKVKTQVHTMPYKTQVRVDIDNMAEVIANSDLAIGASGTTTWERCCLGLPSILFVLAENQKVIAKLVNNVGAAISLELNQMGEICKQIRNTQNQIKSFIENSAEVTNGTGVIQVLKHLK